ncbi:MAG: hypothetical protein KBT11_00815 [Treponema sp.]|nr:hypothetical protein [Candidatus Treponema equifaecale]
MMFNFKNKVKAAFTAAVCSAVIFSGCDDLKSLADMEVPEKISLKSEGAVYEFPLGKGELKVSEKINVEKLREIFNKDDDDKDSQNSDSSGDDLNQDDLVNNVQVYDYNPENKEDALQQYVINYPIQSISLSIFENSDFAKISFATPIRLPDFNSRVTDALSIAGQGFSLVELGTTQIIPDIPPLEVNITSPDFDKIYLKSGVMNVNVSVPDTVSDDFAARIVLKLYDKDTLLSSSEETVISKENVSIPLDLAGKSFGQELNLSISGQMEGGTMGNGNHYEVSMTLSDIRMEKITGLTMDSDELGSVAETDLNKDINMENLNKYLISAEIGDEGLLKLGVALPDGWRGIKCNIEDIAITGGLSIGKDDFVDADSSEFENEGENTGPKNFIFAKKSILSGKTITVKERNSEDTDWNEIPITVTGKIKLSVENATIVFDNGTPINSIDIEGSCEIPNLNKISVDLQGLDEIASKEGGFETGLDFSTFLDDFLSDGNEDLIKNIKFTGIQAYMFMTRPSEIASETSSIDDFYLTGYVTADYETEDSDGSYITKSPTILNATDANPIMLKTTSKTIESAANDKFIITDSSIFTEHADPNENCYSIKIETNPVTSESMLCDIINDLPKNLKLFYQLRGSSNSGILTLDAQEIAMLASSNQISVSLAIVLPMTIVLQDVSDGTVDGKITIPDVMKLVSDKDEEKDLFDRDGAEDEPEWMKYTDIISSVYADLNFDNKIGLDLNAFITNHYDDGSVLEKSVSASGNTKIEFTTDEIKDIFTKYPFSPKIKLEIPIPEKGGLVEIKRNSKFGTTGSINVLTGGTVEIWNKNDSNKEDK